MSDSKLILRCLSYWEQVRDVIQIPENEPQPFWWMPEFSSLMAVHQCVIFIKRLGATMGVYVTRARARDRENRCSIQERV